MNKLTELTQRQLRNDSGEVMRALDRGESFMVTRNGVPVGELTPIRQRELGTRERLAELFPGGGNIDFEQFRADIDAVVDQTFDPGVWDHLDPA